jgi:hypothetical protein
MVPSIGGGTKLIRTLLAGECEGVCSRVGEGAIDCSGEIAGEEDSPGVGEGVGVGDSCAAAIATTAMQEIKVIIWKWRFAIRELSIVAPVHVRKNVVLPFAIAQKFFIEIICDKLIVQTVEASKVIDRALGGVFTRSPGFH